MEAVTTRYAWGARPYLGFNYLSPVPMCRALIDLELMTSEDVAWVDALHETCREQITEELLMAAAVKGRNGAAGAEDDAKAAKEWLLTATEPLRGAAQCTQKRGQLWLKRVAAAAAVVALGCAVARRSK